MKVNLVDILLFILFAQLVSLAPILFFQGQKKNSANSILACFLAAKALCISNFLAFRLYDTTYTYFPHLFYVGKSFTLLWSPLLYFYTKAVSLKNFKFKKHHMFHALPFLIHIIYLCSVFHLHSADRKRELLQAGSIFFTNYFLTYSVFLHVSILVYTLFSARAILTYRKAVKNNFSSIDTINLNWLSFVLLGFITKWIFDVWYFIDHQIDADAFVPLLLSRIILFLFINIMIYKSIKQPAIFAGFEDVQKLKKNSLSQESCSHYAKKLVTFIEKEKPFLDPELSLVDLSDQTNIPPRSLSEVINTRFSKNFYDFINHYRIKESEKYLSDMKTQKTVLEILYHVGFNSKSAFNSAFKKHTGMTPTQFKKLNNATAFSPELQN